MKKILLIFLIIGFNNIANGSIKKNIIQNLIYTENLSFKFEQNINGKIETGNCIIEYPKKIFCTYDNMNNKILVSNGKSLVIKTISSYYNYPLKKTPLNLILDKEFLLKRINKMKINSIEDTFISFQFVENDNIFEMFFDKENHNLIGWQTTDIYQNLSTTYLSSLVINQKIQKQIFNLPTQN